MVTNSSTLAFPTGNAATLENQQRTLALDNLIRRELKVGDPSDPRQIASALLERYKGDPRAHAISSEAKGLPFHINGHAPASVATAPTSTDAEWQQAIDDIEFDLQELTTNALVKDIVPELRGWAQAIRSALKEGYHAARFALDSRQRDKVFGIRRQLNDYARLARLIGALTPAVHQNYRKFAQSLDEAAAVLLVMMGEVLAHIGFGGGRFLLQAPYSELQVRRDAVIHALRNLIGATQEAAGQNDWPRGMDAYRRLFKALEDQGHGDLRALLVENELARIMDELLQRASQGASEGLRAIGSTAQIDLARFRHLVAVSRSLVKPEAPSLTAFLESLLLFAEAFDSAGGFRLLRIARPPILLYGLYGTHGDNQRAEARMLELIHQRALLAHRLDCLADCSCEGDGVSRQIILDKVLYDLDRAIDLYALGRPDADFGHHEQRASAYSYIIDAALLECSVYSGCGSVLPQTEMEEKRGEKNFYLKLKCGKPAEDRASVPIEDGLMHLRGLLRPTFNSQEAWLTSPQVLMTPDPLAARLQELCVAGHLESRWSEMVSSMAPGCINHLHVFNGNGVLVRLIKRGIVLSNKDWMINVERKKKSQAKKIHVTTSQDDDNLIALNEVLTALDRISDDPVDYRVMNISMPPTLETAAEMFVRGVERSGALREELAETPNIVVRLEQDDEGNGSESPRAALPIPNDAADNTAAMALVHQLGMALMGRARAAQFIASTQRLEEQRALLLDSVPPFDREEAKRIVDRLVAFGKQVQAQATEADADGEVKSNRSKLQGQAYQLYELVSGTRLIEQAGSDD
ncbi:hypothetical protein [Pseudomonas indica]|uniref:hypothetical protein n=1 Tax=Pseudomonas indica TaxID=137658 RepID=UPI0023F96835|nr:hypothetical protein [Pseudomonas indica]MBU3056551.1 hypothetical protein [Pseudomonas indica]